MRKQQQITPLLSPRWPPTIPKHGLCLSVPRSPSARHIPAQTRDRESAVKPAFVSYLRHQPSKCAQATERDGALALHLVPQAGYSQRLGRTAGTPRPSPPSSTMSISVRRVVSPRANSGRTQARSALLCEQSRDRIYFEWQQVLHTANPGSPHKSFAFFNLNSYHKVGQLRVRARNQFPQPQPQQRSMQTSSSSPRKAQRSRGWVLPPASIRILNARGMALLNGCSYADLPQALPQAVRSHHRKQPLHLPQSRVSFCFDFVGSNMRVLPTPHVTIRES